VFTELLPGNALIKPVNNIFHIDAPISIKFNVLVEDLCGADLDLKNMKSVKFKPPSFPVTSTVRKHWNLDSGIIHLSPSPPYYVRNGES
jgi:hypothetical protein